MCLKLITLIVILHFQSLSSLNVFSHSSAKKSYFAPNMELYPTRCYCTNSNGEKETTSYGSGCTDGRTSCVINDCSPSDPNTPCASW